MEKRRLPIQRLNKDLFLQLMSYISYPEISVFLEANYFSDRAIHMLKSREYSIRKKYIKYNDDDIDYGTWEDHTLDGEYHNENGPARIYTNVNYKQELWYIYGKLYNHNGAATISTYSDGHVKICYTPTDTQKKWLDL